MSRFASRLNDWSERWLFESPYVSVRGMAAFRVCFALFLLFLRTPGQLDPDLSGYAELPNAFYGPPLGPMMVLPGIPPAFTVDLLTTILTLSLALVCIGWRTRLATAAASLALFSLIGIENSLGKISHDLTLDALVLAIMVFSPWGKALSIDALLARRKGEQTAPDEGVWVGQIVALILGIAFFSAGIQKLLGGWLEWSSHATEYYADLYLFRGDGTELTQTLLRANLGPVWEMADYATVIFEAGFLFAAFKLRWLRAFCAIALLFHAMNYLILDITFISLEILYALFLPWKRLLESRPMELLARGGAFLAEQSTRTLSLIVAASLGFGAAVPHVGSPVVQGLDLLLPTDEPEAVALYALTIVVFIVYLALQAQGFYARLTTATSPQSKRSTA